jgi:macrolide transport system ATP-binding/permease protein
MHWFGEVRRRIATLRDRGRFDRELDAEMRCHLELQAEENESRGMSPREARWAAQRQFGNSARLLEHSRDAWGWTALETLAGDIRYAARQLLAAKGYTLTAVATLALGIGANAGIFTLMHAVFLKSLPVADPEGLVRLGDGDNCCGLGWSQGRYSTVSYPLYRHLRDNTPEFTRMAAFQAGFRQVGVRRAGTESSHGLVRQFVSGNYFELLGIGPYAGRLLTGADDRRGAPAVAVISYRAWQQQYGGDPSVIGGSFTIDGFPFTVVGVAPPGFFGAMLRPNPPDFWLPLATEPSVHGARSSLEDKGLHWLYVLGRLRPGSDSANVEAGLNTKLHRWIVDNGWATRQDAARQYMALAPGGAGVSQMRDGYRTQLPLLFWLTGLVLVIACANLANLQLSRGAGTAAQTSLRVAIGASRFRLMRQVLIESTLLAVLGGAAGLLVAWQTAELLIRLTLRGVTFVPIETAPSAAVLGFTFAVAVVSGVLFGIVPAWSASKADPAVALRSSGRAASGRAMRPQRVLLVAQVAVSVVLLAAAGLMARSLRNLASQSFGFQLDNLVAVSINANFGGYPPGKMASLYADMQTRMLQVPGVRQAALAQYAPMSGDNWSMPITFEHDPSLRANSSFNRVSPSFFDTVGAHIVRGRGFDEAKDRPGATQVVVVNEAFVQRWFPNQDPIGRRFGLGDHKNRADYTIVGVVSTIRFRQPRQPGYPMFFLPLLQMTAAEWANPVKARSNIMGTVLLRTEGVCDDVASHVTRALGAVDPNVTALRLDTLPAMLEQQLSQEHTIGTLARLFAIVALLLASIGLYGLTDYSVARRRGEIGVRTALGASRSQVIGMILKGALAQTAVGLTAGVVGAVAAGRVLAGLVYGVGTSDPVAIAVACCVLCACAAAAAAVPALRASRVDPSVALRAE